MGFLSEPHRDMAKRPRQKLNSKKLDLALKSASKFNSTMDSLVGVKVHPPDKTVDENVMEFPSILVLVDEEMQAVEVSDENRNDNSENNHVLKGMGWLRCIELRL